LFSHDDEGKPNTFTWRSRIGEQNVDVTGDGSGFAPYVTEPDAIRFGDSRYEFLADGQGLKRLGQQIVSRSRLYVQRKQGNNWLDVPHGLPTRNIVNDYPREGRCTAYLDFPGVQGYAAGSRLQVGTELGGNDKQIFGFRLRSSVSGTFRLEWVVEIPGNVGLSWITRPTSLKDPTPIRIGGQVGPLMIRWSREEAPFRNATVEDDGHGGKILRIILGPYTLGALEWLTVYPDTWGTDVGIAATADDGTEFDGSWYPDGGFEGDNIHQGVYTGSLLHWGTRWDGITIAGTATIDNAVIDLNRTGGSGTGGAGTIRAWDHDNAPIFSGANVPSAVSKTTAGVSFTPSAGNGIKTTGNLASVVQEIIDRAGWASGNAINFCCIYAGAGTNYANFEDYIATGTAEPELTITYTPAGGGTAVPIGAIIHHYKQLGVM